jgi:pimeloyl-ACP methyl ester carboxylesterase
MVRVQGLDFHVRDVGDKQPALVFLHYWGGTGRTWNLVIRELAGRHRCVAPDLRGWGPGRPAMSRDDMALGISKDRLVKPNASMDARI